MKWKISFATVVVPLVMGAVFIILVVGKSVEGPRHLLSNPATTTTTTTTAGGSIRSRSRSSSSSVKWTVNHLNAWSKFLPRTTQFTDHVVNVVSAYNMQAGNREELCSDWINLRVDAPYTVPTIIECKISSSVWCAELRELFAAGRVLPYNISIGIDMHDFFFPKRVNNACIGNSSPDGKLTMPNMEELATMTNAYGRYPQRLTQWPGRADIPFELRKTTPVFRGAAWIDRTVESSQCTIVGQSYTSLLQHLSSARYKAVDFSVDHHALLNARFTRSLVGPCWERNATNGLSKLLPADVIRMSDYFSNYQSALVLAGIGAAFRLNRHFMVKTAVLLQDYDHVEWYTPYLTPWVHYIPLARDLSDLRERLMWVSENPDEVKMIGENGFEFYTQHLTFEHNHEHIYELVYRLSEYNHSLNTKTPPLKKSVA